MPKIDFKMGGGQGGGPGGQGGSSSVDWGALGNNSLFKSLADACLAQGSASALSAAFARASGISPQLAKNLFGGAGAGAGTGGGGSMAPPGIGGGSNTFNITQHISISVKGFEAGLSRISAALEKIANLDRGISAGIQDVSAGLTARAARRREPAIEHAIAAPPLLLPASTKERVVEQIQRQPSLAPSMTRIEAAPAAAPAPVVPRARAAAGPALAAPAVAQGSPPSPPSLILSSWHGGGRGGPLSPPHGPTITMQKVGGVWQMPGAGGGGGPGGPPAILGGGPGRIPAPFQGGPAGPGIAGGGGGGGGGGGSPGVMMPPLGPMALGIGAAEVAKKLFDWGKAAIIRGEKGADLIVQMGKLATAGGFPAGNLRAAMGLGGGELMGPPPAWAGAGITQRQGLGLLRAYPFMPRSAAGAMNLVSTIGTYGLVPGLSRMAPEQVAAMMGRAQMMMPAGGSISGGAAQAGRLLAGAGQSLQAAGLPLDQGLSSFMSQAGSISGNTTAPINMAGLFNFQTSFQRIPGASPMEGVAAAQRYADALASSEGMGAMGSSPLRQYLTMVELKKWGGNLPGLFGKEAYAALATPGSATNNMLIAYKDAYRKFGPYDIRTQAIFSELKGSLARSNPGAARIMAQREVNLLTPYEFGNNDTATKALFGKWWTNQATLEDYEAGNVSSGRGLGIAPPGAMEAWLQTSGGKLGSAMLGPFNPSLTGFYRSALQREGVDPRAIENVIKAGAISHVSPIDIGAILVNESAGGNPAITKNGGAGQLHPSAIMELARKSIRPDLIPPGLANNPKAAQAFINQLSPVANMAITGVYKGYVGDPGKYRGLGYPDTDEYRAKYYASEERAINAPAGFGQTYGNALSYKPTLEALSNAGDMASYGVGQEFTDSVNLFGKIVHGMEAWLEGVAKKAGGLPLPPHGAPSKKGFSLAHPMGPGYNPPFLAP